MLVRFNSDQNLLTLGLNVVVFPTFRQIPLLFLEVIFPQPQVISLLFLSFCKPFFIPLLMSPSVLSRKHVKNLLSKSLISPTEEKFNFLHVYWLA